MKFNSRIFSVSLALGVMAWLLDAMIGAFVFREGSFLDLALLDVPAEELVFRVVVLGLLVAFGFVVSNILFQREIRDRENSRRALEESEARFKELAELLPEPVFEADLSIQITYANRRALELFGYTGEEVEAGVSGLDMLLPEHRPEAKRSLGRMLDGEEVGVTEYTAVRKDGSTFPMLFHAALVQEEGRPVGMRGVIVDISHRKEAVEVLRASEERFRNIVEASPMGVFLYDLEEDGRLVLAGANRAADEILGVDTHPLVGKTLEEAFPLLAGTEVPDRFREAAAQGTPWQSEEIVYNDGTIQGAYETSAFQTAPSQMAVMFLDVTERKAAAEAVRASEERLRLATQSSRVGTWEYDLSTDDLAWDDLMYQLHGVKREGAKPGIARWKERVHPQDLERAEGEFREALTDGGEPFDTEFRIVRGDTGEIRHIRGLAGVVRDEEGKATRAVGTNWDITQSKHIEAALRDSEGRFRSVIEQLNDATYILHEGRFDLVNPRFTELTGVSAEEAAGPDFSFWDLVAPGSVPIIQRRQEQRERGEEIPGIYEFEIKHKDGHLVQVEASVTEIEYKGGTAVLGLLRDVTLQKNLKEQLLLAQRMESIGRLSGGVAHDLNNLLTPVIGYGDLVLSEFSAEDERRESVQEILEAAFRAKDLVRQLLAFGRQQAMEFSSIDLNQMVRGFKSLLRRAVREDIHIQFSPHASDPVIRGDRGQLEQVIMNLVVNAQDAMPEGGALIIETGAVELDEEYARAHTGVTPGLYGMISVSDTGVGMDALTRERIFEPFFTTKERGKGTGLGLATVYGIIKQHGGNIWAYSEPGEGTTFKCYLPLTEEPAAEPTPQPAQDQDRGGSETVMVVEDEEAVRSLAVKVLKRRGYEVMEAEDAPSCLARLQAHEGSLDLLLTDVVMPGMNGRQLYGEIEDLYPGVKVLYMSGYTRDIITHRGVLDDGIPFIQKPFSVQGLATRVRAILEGE